MDENSRAIIAEVNHSIAILRFNRPLKRNPLSLSTLQELESSLSALFPRDDIEALESLPAGVELKDFREL